MFTLPSCIVLAQLLNYFYSNFWTVYQYRNDVIFIMKVLNCTGIAFQLFIKFFIATFKKKKMFAMCEMVETELFKKYSSRKEKEGEMVYGYAVKFRLILKLLVLLYLSSLFMFVLYPVYIYFVQGELVAMFVFEFPYIDPETTIGFILTNVLQVILYVTGIWGLVLADGLFLVYVVHALLFMDIFELHMKQLDEMLHNQDGTSNDLTVEDRWRQCLQEHQAIAEYMGDIEDIISFICLVTVFTSAFAICDNIVLAILTDWYASYMYLMICFTSMTIYFVIGNMIDRKYESMHMCIVSFPWHLMNARQKKEYQILLNRMDHPFTLSMYGYSPLNFESYMTILKALYQFVMFVFQFVVE